MIVGIAFPISWKSCLRSKHAKCCALILMSPIRPLFLSKKHWTGQTSSFWGCRTRCTVTWSCLPERLWWTCGVIGLNEPIPDLGKRRPRGRKTHYEDSCHRGCRRSEEHTSELQSLAYLVCRLLLEKKKKKKSSFYVR